CRLTTTPGSPAATRFAPVARIRSSASAGGSPSAGRGAVSSALAMARLAGKVLLDEDAQRRHAVAERLLGREAHVVAARPLMRDGLGDDDGDAAVGVARAQLRGIRGRLERVDERRARLRAEG